MFGSFFQLSKIEGLKSVTEFLSGSSNAINFHVSSAAVVVFMNRNRLRQEFSSVASYSHS